MLQSRRELSDCISLAAHNALKRRHLNQRITDLAKELRDRYNSKEIVGHDPKMVDVLRLVMQVAGSDATILIRGRSGTEKELIARRHPLQQLEARWGIRRCQLRRPLKKSCSSDLG